MRRPLTRFIVVVLAWLPVCFVVWYFTAPLLTLPVQWLAIAVAKLGFSDMIIDVEKSGALFSFVTNLRPASATSFTAGKAAIVVDARSLLYTYGLPLFAALALAATGFANPRRLVQVLAIGYLVLIPFHTWGVFADALKQLAITMGPAISSQTGFSSFQREVIAFAYQIGTLILPTVIPAIIWVLTHRPFLERMSADLARSGK
ncbi:MAG: exosortase H-associated membrane protein [Betaproteobacteria bacterium]